MVIAFSNQKGGVGKSTICLSLANYWANMGLPVHVVDTDMQRTLMQIREDELRKTSDKQPSFAIEFKRLEHFIQELPFQQEGEEVWMIDLPGSFNPLIIEVLKCSDSIIVPFQYEETVLTTTGQFATYLDMIEGRYPRAEGKRQAIFVPNKVDYSVGRKEDIEHWNAWKAAIEAVSILTPPIPDWVCMQRKSSLSLSSKELACVTPCFEYITQLVFPKPLTKDKEDNQ